MGYLLSSILLCYISQDNSTTIIIKVNINIRKRNTVWIKETLKSKSYWIGSICVIPKQYATAEPAAEPRPGPTETPICLVCINKVLHNKKVSRESHILNSRQLKVKTLYLFLCQLLSPNAFQHLHIQDGANSHYCP